MRYNVSELLLSDQGLDAVVHGVDGSRVRGTLAAKVQWFIDGEIPLEWDDEVEFDKGYVP